MWPLFVMCVTMDYLIDDGDGVRDFLVLSKCLYLSSLVCGAGIYNSNS